jgi:tetratricopeptide (TPR) repeat protein
MLSRYRRAHRASQRAAQLFQVLGDTSGEVMALTTHAFVSINLGRNEEAVEAALLSVRLSQFLEKDEHSVLSYNALGVAYFWSHSFEKAEQALRTAIQIAEQARPALSTFQPRVNQWWTEVIRVFYERYYVGALPALDQLRTLREAVIAVMAGGDRPGATAPGTHVTTEAVLLFGLALDQCWHGRIGQARLDVDALANWAQRYGTVTWLWPSRAGCGPRSPGPSRTGLPPAACRAHDRHRGGGRARATGLPGPSAVVQLYVAQGHNGEALDELRRLRLREQLIRSDGLDTREKVVEWQVDLRQRQQSVDRLEITSRQLEKLSLEDTLTGIPNRRSFELYAGELLRAGHGARAAALRGADRRGPLQADQRQLLAPGRRRGAQAHCADPEVACARGRHGGTPGRRRVRDRVQERRAAHRAAGLRAHPGCGALVRLVHHRRGPAVQHQRRRGGGRLPVTPWRR